ncbi:hypothetical protein [Rhizobium sp. 18055]|uniref:hypothetical protein n=1 Tax=Rhizobium sp. 18055 TaxID=2681403 RepID=UPI00135A325F|nr:hypothetical protein [Rhizobium sp. 18055]
MDDKLTEVGRNELLHYVLASLDWGNADVFACGSRESILRLGEIAAYVLMLVDGKGESRASSVRVVLPPSGSRLRSDMIESVREGAHRAFRRFDADDAKIEPFVAEAMSNILIEQAANFTAKTLGELLASSDVRQSVIVGEAAHYRCDASFDGDPAVRIAEDIWCRHLRFIMLIAEESAQKTGSHIILDIGEYLPASNVNIDLLKSAGDVGLCGVSQSQSLTPEEVIAKVTAIHEHVDAGNLGKALATIDQDDTLSEERKWLMRLVAFEKGALT